VSAGFPGSDEQRRYLRVPLRVELLPLERGEQGSRRIYAINLSLTGMCVQSPLALAQGARIQVLTWLVPNGPPVELETEVVWCTAEEERPSGMAYFEIGLHFVDPSAADTQKLRAFVDRNHRYCEVQEIQNRRPVAWSG